MSSTTATRKGLSRILFVPDDLLTGEVRESFLDRASFLVRTANDADAALAMAEIWRPSLVVFRSDLDGVRASDFCQRLRNARLPKTPKLMMVTEQFGSGHEDAAGAACDCHLISPVNNEQLLITIAALLEVQRRRSPRAALETLVQAQGFLTVEGKSEPTLGNCVNVSEDGMLLECNRQLPLNTEGSVQFFLPGSSERLLLRGTVRLAIDEIRLHYAIEWQNIAPSQRSSIKRYVEECGGE
jgi:CheY-like chemotaxis protein